MVHRYRTYLFSEPLEGVAGVAHPKGHASELEQAEWRCDGPDFFIFVWVTVLPAGVEIPSPPYIFLTRNSLKPQQVIPSPIEVLKKILGSHMMRLTPRMGL